MCIMNIRVLLLSASALCAQAATQPHIVFILADDLGFADVSYHPAMYGNSSNVANTPFIDSLAYAGVRLENYYIQPLCSPTRATLLTGRIPLHTGIHMPFSPSQGGGLSVYEVTMAQILKRAGYATHGVGKWHLGFENVSMEPQSRGFDSWFGYYGGNTDYYSHQTQCWYPDEECFGRKTVLGQDLHNNSEIVWDKGGQYSTELYAETAANIIRMHAASEVKPLFLFLPFQAVHSANLAWPEQAPQRYIDMYNFIEDSQRRNLSAMITAMDDGVKTVVTALNETGMWEDTIFVFSTDNGGPLNGGASNYPLRGGKVECWEGGARGVGLVHGPSISGGRISRDLMHISDWLPTFCEAAGCDPNGSPAGPLDGVSQWGMLSRGAASARTSLVIDLHAGDVEKQTQPRAMRFLNWKLIYGYAPNKTHGFLFDVDKDPSETNDLSTLHSDVATKILGMMNELAATGVPDYYPPQDPRADPKLHNGSWVAWDSTEQVSII